jgi:hypothetical protein
MLAWLYLREQPALEGANTMAKQCPQCRKIVDISLKSCSCGLHFQAEPKTKTDFIGMCIRIAGGAAALAVAAVVILRLA